MCVVRLCTFAEIGLLVQDSFCRHNLPIPVHLPHGGGGGGGGVCVYVCGGGGGGGGGFDSPHCNKLQLSAARLDNINCLVFLILR